MTCTLNPAENQERVELFCQRHPECKLLETWQSPPDSPLNEFFWAAQLRWK
jgi:16S rRNA (cytosine967-C5)-methyltransferase